MVNNNKQNSLINTVIRSLQTRSRFIPVSNYIKFI